MEERSDDVPLQPPAPTTIGISYNLKKGVSSDIPDIEAEYDNIDTVYAIRDALEAVGFKTLLLEADETLPEKLKNSRVDMVFNIAEGSYGRGREAQVPALLNFFGIPFTGSDETTLCLALDKALTKRLLAAYRVRTPKYRVLDGHSAAGADGLRFPVIIKPNTEGSSKGISDISIAEDKKQFKALVSRTAELYRGTVLAEEYIGGREFTVGLLGNGFDVRVFAPMEIIFKRDTQKNYRVYDYGVKQDYKNYIDYRCPAELTQTAEREMKQTALRIFNALGCRDCARVDFRMADDGLIYFIEINPLPGLAPGYSDYPMLAEFSGISYGELIVGILRAAAIRCGLALRPEAEA